MLLKTEIFPVSGLTVATTRLALVSPAAGLRSEEPGRIGPGKTVRNVGALGAMPLIVAMLMLAMAGNIFVAFGLLGVFGVVRFRNVLKDTRDTIFILWAVMEGVAVGTTRFSTAAMGASAGASTSRPSRE